MGLGSTPHELSDTQLSIILLLSSSSSTTTTICLLLLRQLFFSILLQLPDDIRGAAADVLVMIDGDVVVVGASA